MKNKNNYEELFDDILDSDNELVDIKNINLS